MMATRTGSRPPRKIFHKIGEVCDLTKTEPYVLRYWESEFPFLAPEKNRAGQRIYTDEDIETVLAIKRLLYEEGYTTAGARRRLEKEREDRAAEGPREGGTTAAVIEASTNPTGAAPASATPAAAQAHVPGTGGAEVELRGALREVRDGLRSLRASLSGQAAPASPDEPTVSRGRRGRK